MKFPSNFANRVRRDPVCVVPDCGEKHLSKGLCRLHYDRLVAGPHRFDPVDPDLAQPLLCVCDVDPVPTRFAGWGCIVCVRCERPPRESLDIDWTPELLAQVQADTYAGATDGMIGP